jgi:2-phospho-L-lactate guanylyltransferase
MPTRSETIAIVPVKPFGRGKSRLSAELEPSARKALSRALFFRALRACLDSPLVDRVLVLTGSAEIERACRSARVAVLPDPAPAVGFSAVLERGLLHAQACGASRALVAMSDLATVTPADFGQLARALDHADVVLAPDAARIGLGALATRLPARAQFVLGRGASLRRNVAIARERGLRLQLLCTPGLAFDIDTPGDLAAYRALNPFASARR